MIDDDRQRLLEHCARMIETLEEMMEDILWSPPPCGAILTVLTASR